MKLIEIRKNGSIRVSTVNTEPSKTDQQWEPETNVNNILSKWAAGQPITHIAKTQGQYIDVSAYGSFQEAANVVSAANQQFSTLHPLIRERFHQNPSQLIAFLHDPKNREEAETLGLIPKQKPTVTPSEDKRQRVQETTQNTLNKNKIQEALKNDKPNDE